MAKVIDSVCEVVDKRHTIEAIEEDRGVRPSYPLKPADHTCESCLFFDATQFNGLAAPCDNQLMSAFGGTQWRYYYQACSQWERIPPPVEK